MPENSRHFVATGFQKTVEPAGLGGTSRKVNHKAVNISSDLFPSEYKVLIFISAIPYSTVAVMPRNWSSTQHLTSDSTAFGGSQPAERYNRKKLLKGVRIWIFRYY